MDTTSADATGLADSRPANSQLYPWYDSVWLSQYTEAKAIVQTVKPSAFAEFEGAFQVLHTRPDFRVQLLEHPFDDAALAEIKHIAESLHPTELELHEAKRFGRFIVHDHPFFTQLQQRVVPMVSELVGESVEAKYNFLSLYTGKGVCAVHMDAPEAKWTLDLCIDQSAPWPIYFSDVQPWPDTVDESWRGDGWEKQIKQSHSLKFTPYTLHPGQAVIFSGSSQWHYRDPMPEAKGTQFCTLLFFHFIPKGTAEIVKPRNWARIFGIPELTRISERNSS